MKVARKKIAPLIITIILLLSGCDMILYTPYIPMYRHSDSDHAIEKDESLLTSAHLRHIQIILEKNNEKFHMKKGVLYIKRALQWDVDLLSNYTMKAVNFEENKLPTD